MLVLIKDPGRVVGQSKIELPSTWALLHKRSLAKCIPCKIITEGSHGLHRSVANIFKKNGGGEGEGERVGSNRSNFDKVLGELL